MDDALTPTMALLRLEGLGPARYWQLIEACGSAAAALERLPDPLLQKLPARARQQWCEYRSRGTDSDLMRWVAAEQERCRSLGVQLFDPTHEHYPPLLRETDRPPPILYLRGNPAALQLPQVAVVGARRASRAGLDNARAFARDLAAGGFTITSGLALGVDGAAHRGALDAGGTTVAVLGSGVDRIYPRRHDSLAAEILDGNGALLSEQPLGSAAEAANFPRRNRIISGLASGVLLVEAAVRSGSLITARLALEQNREVFAIPGSIHHPLARGCHAMIKQGAALVETSADIVAQLGGVYIPHSPPAAVEQELSPEEQRLVAAIGGDPRSLEQLAAATGEQAATMMATLIQMELAGLVEQVVGGYQLTVAGAAHLEAVQ